MHQVAIPYKITTFYAVLLSTSALRDGGGTPAILFAIFAFGLWYRKKWALWGVIVLSFVLAAVWTAVFFASDAELAHIRIPRPTSLQYTQRIAVPLAVALIMLHALWKAQSKTSTGATIGQESAPE